MQFAIFCTYLDHKRIINLLILILWQLSGRMRDIFDEAMQVDKSLFNANKPKSIFDDEIPEAPCKHKDPEHPSFWEFRLKPNPDYVGAADEVCAW